MLIIFHTEQLVNIHRMSFLTEYGKDFESVVHHKLKNKVACLHVYSFSADERKI